MGCPPTLLQILQQDPALQQDADFLFTMLDRMLIDAQFRVAEGHLLQALLSGQHCTWMRLDIASGSVPVKAGDVVCSAGSTSATVTKATSAAIRAAGAALGIVILGGPPGAMVLVALSGIIPAAIVGLTPGAGLYASVSSSGQVQTASSAGTYPLGTVDASGNLTLQPTPAVVLGTNVSGLYLSTVDMAVGYGQNLGALPASSVGSSYHITYGVGFTATQAGHYCTGLRFYRGDTSPLTLTLWEAGGTSLATTTYTPSAAGVWSASFSSKVALTPGTLYSVTLNDPLGVWWYYGVGQSHLQSMTHIMPAGYATETVQWGPFVAGADFLGGSSMNDVYGLFYYNNSGIPQHYGYGCPDSSNTTWSPVEPMVA